MKRIDFTVAEYGGTVETEMLKRIEDAARDTRQGPSEIMQHHMASRARSGPRKLSIAGKCVGGRLASLLVQKMKKAGL